MTSHRSPITAHCSLLSAYFSLFFNLNFNNEHCRRRNNRTPASARRNKARNARREPRRSDLDRVESLRFIAPQGANRENLRRRRRFEQGSRRLGLRSEFLSIQDPKTKIQNRNASVFRNRRLLGHF